jgi:hypothetical protein
MIYRPTDRQSWSKQVGQEQHTKLLGYPAQRSPASGRSAALLLIWKMLLAESQRE